MRSRPALVSIALFATAVGGCSGSGITPAGRGESVAVSLQDFELNTSAVNVAAGLVTFEVANNGPSTHELKVDRTILAADNLPIDETGLSVAEGSPLLHREGSVEAAGLGTRHKLTLALAPGNYVAYCDIEAHYLSGMRVTISVH